MILKYESLSYYTNNFRIEMGQHIFKYNWNYDGCRDF